MGSSPELLASTDRLEAKQLRMCLLSKRVEVKSSQGLLFSEAKKPYAEAVGQTGAQGLVRGCGSLVYAQAKVKKSKRYNEDSFWEEFVYFLLIMKPNRAKTCLA